MKLPRLLRGLAAVAAVTALSMTSVAPAGAAEPRPDGRSAARAALVTALQRDLGLSPAQTERLLGRQAGAADLEKKLAAQLGADFGGAWFDARTGKLVVAVTRAERARQARGSGADTVVVKRSKRTLDAIKANLDTLVDRDRRALSAAVAWSVDVQRNQVVVTARAGRQKALAPVLARYGDAVRVEQSDRTPQLTADYLDGGDPYGGCSVGFNVTSNGAGHFLTAGHCGRPGDVASQGGVTIGPFVASYFPGDDDALVRNDNPGYWIQGPWVFAYNGDPNAVYTIKGYRDSPVGTAVCKSGRTTGLTCGQITAKNETVNYAEGAVHQLTRHSACVEKGDSGGSNFSFDAGGNYAEGMTSGASLVLKDGRLRCLQADGRQNLSWYQPIAESIAFYGVTLMTG